MIRISWSSWCWRCWSLYGIVQAALQSGTFSSPNTPTVTLPRSPLLPYSWSMGNWGYKNKNILNTPWNILWRFFFVPRGGGEKGLSWRIGWHLWHLWQMWHRKNLRELVSRALLLPPGLLTDTRSTMQRTLLQRWWWPVIILVVITMITTH